MSLDYSKLLYMKKQKKKRIMGARSRSPGHLTDMQKKINERIF